MKALSRTRTHQLLGLLLAFSLYSCADESEGPGSGEADGGDDGANTDDATSSSDESSSDENSDPSSSDPSSGDPSNSDPSSGDGSDTDDSDAASDTDSEGTNSDDSETAVTDDTDGAGGTSSDATSTDSDMSGGAPGVGGAGGSNSGGAGAGGAAGADGNAGAGGLTGSGGAGGNSGEPSVDARCADALPEALAGAGSADDPYLLCLAEQLRLLGSVAYPLDAAYALGDDLDASTLTPALPTLGSVETPFNGSLDGQRHLVVGLTASLFEAIETDGQVLDLRLNSDVDASMQSTSWGLLTKNNRGTVRGVEGSGTIIGGDHVGMLIGTNQGLVEDCFVSGSVISEGAHIGGLMGVNLGTVRRSGSTVTVSGRARVGSLVGRQSAPGLVEECYALGSATSDQFVGGLIGTAFGGEILNSYARSVLVTGLEPGGLVGDATSTTITNSYAASALSGDGAEGLVGLAAADASTVTNSYFLDTATGSLGTALSAEQMTLPASFSGWDFDAVWQLEAGAEFPSLRFESGQ